MISTLHSLILMPCSDIFLDHNFGDRSFAPPLGAIVRARERTRLHTDCPHYQEKRNCTPMGNYYRPGTVTSQYGWRKMQMQILRRQMQIGWSSRRWISLARSQGSSKVPNTLAIRRETVNAWERRAPLAPKHVRRLVAENDTRVLIQPSNRRTYPIQEYSRAGAIVQEDISEAPVIIGVKQVPNESLLPDTTYAFFSHTIKAQEDNMEMLDVILNRNIRLIDYEKMVDSRGARLVAFGVWAGYCGLIDILHGLGLRLLGLGHRTPFLHIGLAHNYRDKHTGLNDIRHAGYEIALDMMPRSLGPLTFVFTGSGNVSKGAQELFESFPHEYVSVDNLDKVAKDGRLDRLYGCVVSRKDHLVRQGGGRYDPQEFYAHPERYGSVFAKKIAPYASVIINGIFWTKDHPRLITTPDAKNLLRTINHGGQAVPGCPTVPHHLLAVCDISADPGGSIEFVSECTTIDKPFVIYDPDSNQTHHDFDAPNGVLICSIDNMPAQMPTEATEYFGDRLMPFIPEMLQSDAHTPFHHFRVSPVLRNAVIASNQALTPNFQYISQLRQQQQ